jgi:type I restriction enzyme S subunit
MKLNEVCDFIVDCEHKTAPLDPNGEFISIRTPNIGKGRFILDGVNRVSRETYEKWTRRGKPAAGDLIMAREAPVGNVAVIVDEENICLGQRTVLIRPDSSKADSAFLTYYLLSDYGQMQVHGESTGATVAHLNMSDIRDIDLIDFPPLPTQQRIASILSAYDDLIEVNNQRIKLLEETAREIYKEWFVRMRFPGWKKAKMVKGVPEGWEKADCYSIAEVKGGGTPLTTNPAYWDGDIMFFTPTDHSDSFYVMTCEKRINQKGLENSSTKMFPKNSTFITARGSVGNICLASEEMAMNQSCFGLIAKEKLDEFFLFTFVDEMIGYLKQVAIGATFDAITLNTFKNYYRLIPPQSLRRAFDDYARPLFAQIENLIRQNSQLRQIRDRLLPRLVSGKLLIRES